MTNYNPELDDVFRALGDPTRRAVLQRLLAGPSPVKQLAQPFDMALPSFLKHIAVLEECGLISSRKVGRVRTCSISPRKLGEAESWLRQQREIWEGRSDRLAAFVETGHRKGEL